MSREGPGDAVHNFNNDADVAAEASRPSLHEPQRPVPAAGSMVTDPESHPELHTGFPAAPPYENLAADSYADLRTAHEFPAQEYVTDDLPPLHPQASHATHATHATHGQRSTRTHGFAQSLRSLMPGGSMRKSQDSHSKEASEEGKEEEQEQPVESPEELAKKQQDPEYLLDTILEEPEHSSGESMVPVGDMAAEVSSSAGISTDSSLQMRRKGYHENLMRNRRLRRYTRTSRKIQWLRHWYNRITNSSLIIRLFIWWFPIAAILFVPLAVGAFDNRDMKLGGTRVMWIFIWLEVVWASLFICKVIVHHLPEVFAFFITVLAPRFFKFVNLFVALELPIHLVLWTFISFITFSPILNDNKDATDKHHMVHWQVIIQDILVAFLVSAIVFLCEQLFMYFLSTNFHRTRMSLRIQEHKKSKNILIILLDAAYKVFPFGSDEFAEEDRALYFQNLQRAQRHTQKSKISQFKGIKKLGHAMNNAAKLVSDYGGMDKQPPVAKTVKDAMSSKETAAILAERIWKSLVMEDSDALTYDDLIGVLGEDKKEEVLYMFDILDKNGSGGIDLEQMKTNVVGINREAKAIARSLLDVDGAITKLHHLLLFLCLIIVIIIFVGMLAPSSNSVLATLGSTLLSMSWLFSATAQEVFNSVIFLFVKHPFDVGDWVLAVVPGENGGGTTRMRVVELNLMYTVFWYVGYNIRIQTSNAVLNTMWIENLTRSPGSQIDVTIIVGIPETRFEQLAELEYRLNEFCDDNPREYLPGVYFQTGMLPDLDRLSVSICFNTRISQDDIVQFATRKTKALQYLARCISEIGIMVPRRTDNTYTDPTLPLFQYNVRDEKEALKYKERVTGLRKPYGMLPPLSEVPSAMDGFVDTEIDDTYDHYGQEPQEPPQQQHQQQQQQQRPHQPLYGHFHPFAEPVVGSDSDVTGDNGTGTPVPGQQPAGAALGERRTSFLSHASSTTSRLTQTQAARGLRSRRQSQPSSTRNMDVDLD